MDVVRAFTTKTGNTRKGEHGACVVAQTALRWLLLAATRGENVADLGVFPFLFCLCAKRVGVRALLLLLLLLRVCVLCYLAVSMALLRVVVLCFLLAFPFCLFFSCFFLFLFFFLKRQLSTRHSPLLLHTPARRYQALLELRYSS